MNLLGFMAAAMLSSEMRPLQERSRFPGDPKMSSKKARKKKLDKISKNSRRRNRAK